MNSIRKKIFLGFAIIILLMAGMGVFGLQILSGVNNSVKSMYHEQVMGVNLIKEAQYNLGLAQRAEKNVLLSDTIKDKREHSKHLENFYSNGIIKNLNEFKGMSNHGVQDGIDELITKINNFKDIQMEIINSSMNGSQDEAIKLASESMRKASETEKIIKEIIEHKLEEANKYYDSSQRSYNNAVRLVIIALSITILATIVMSIMLANSIVKPLHKSIDFAQSLSKGDLTKQINNKFKDESKILVEALNTTGNKLKEIMLNIKEVSNNVDYSSEQLSTALDDSNISMDSIGCSISQIGSNIQEVTNLVENIEKRMHDISKSSSDIIVLTKDIEDNSRILKNETQNAEQAVDILLHNNSDIEMATKEVKYSVEELSKLSKGISEIVDIIANIANQTNMLALNANIEAARAGVNGQGFSIVAEEVKKLSDESASATKKIEDMILMVQNQIEKVANNTMLTEEKVTEGSRVVSDTNENINRVMIEVENVIQNVDKIKRQCSNQHEYIELITDVTKGAVENAQKVTDSANQINSSIQEQIATSEEIGATSEQLSSMTDKLDKMIDYFKV